MYMIASLSGRNYAYSNIFIVIFLRKRASMLKNKMIGD
jgi:hypothetical protein